MCHLILLLPIIGLVVFWIWPLSVALPVYIAILVISGTMYWMILKSMRRPVTTGTRGMIGKSVEVIDMSNHVGHVRAGGAIWNAESSDSLRAGDKATILGVDDLTLRIGKKSGL